MREVVKINIICYVKGKPRGKERPRVGRGGHIYTPKNTKEYEYHIRNCFLDQVKDHTITDKPIYLYLDIRLKIPKSKTISEKNRLCKGIYASKKPDIDNVEKVVLDALNKVAYEDDAQCVAVFKIKRWVLTDEEEGVIIKIGDIDTIEGMQNDINEFYKNITGGM